MLEYLDGKGGWGLRTLGGGVGVPGRGGFECLGERGWSTWERGRST